ncbi:CbtB domain-containing protein [Aureimonas psammosilenae]|uniref:CbtB domain-containing protein n=1 Tax=Aureimonas psammosilenae TaxID=2495496 RepID=UPI0012609A46|nr:CbtB domain-containing protein [Aureimonas psammosilenae]
MIASHDAAGTHTGALPLSSRLLAGFAALILGAFFIWGAGFAGATTIHDTAHDARHGFGFPCH